MSMWLESWGYDWSAWVTNYTTYMYMYMYLVIGNIGVCCIELKYNVLRYCVYDHVCVTAMLQELHSMFHV